MIALNKMPLICSTDVAKKLEKYKFYTSNQNTTKDVDVQNLLYTDLLQSMRKDLYGTKVNKEFPTITLQGNKGDANET